MRQRFADRAFSPFLSTQSSAISEGVYFRNSAIKTQIYTTTPAKLSYVEIGLFSRLKNELIPVFNTKNPSHIMILADYGHGKSFSLQCIQSIIHTETDYPTIGITLGSSTEIYNTNTDPLLNTVLILLREAFEGLSEDSFPNKKAVQDKYCLMSNTKILKEQHLRNFDNAFKELDCLVFILIDELEKVLLEDAVSNENKRKFLSNLKSLADIFQESISIWAAGTNNVEVFINSVGKDQMQRFVEVKPVFNSDETIDYIRNKCYKVVELLPFSSGVMKRIHEVTKGNVRFVNRICRDLWLVAANMGDVVKLKEYEEYLVNTMKPYIFEKYPEVGNHIINAISYMVLNKYLSTITLKHMIGSKIKIQETIDFLESNPNVFEKIDRSYKMRDDEKDVILKKALGVRL